MSGVMLDSQRSSVVLMQTFSKYYMSESSLSSLATISHDKTNNEIDTVLVHWEEFALCIEEHFHAREMFNRKPQGKPMGHR